MNQNQQQQQQQQPSNYLEMRQKFAKQKGHRRTQSSSSEITASIQFDQINLDALNTMIELHKLPDSNETLVALSNSKNKEIEKQEIVEIIDDIDDDLGDIRPSTNKLASSSQKKNLGGGAFGQFSFPTTSDHSANSPKTEFKKKNNLLMDIEIIKEETDYDYSAKLNSQNSSAKGENSIKPSHKKSLSSFSQKAEDLPKARVEFNPKKIYSPNNAKSTQFFKKNFHKKNKENMEYFNKNKRSLDFFKNDGNNNSNNTPPMTTTPSVQFTINNFVADNNDSKGNSGSGSGSGGGGYMSNTEKEHILVLNNKATALLEKKLKSYESLTGELKRQIENLDSQQKKLSLKVDSLIIEKTTEKKKNEILMKKISTLEEQNWKIEKMFNDLKKQVQMKGQNDKIYAKPEQNVTKISLNESPKNKTSLQIHNFNLQKDLINKFPAKINSLISPSHKIEKQNLKKGVPISQLFLSKSPPVNQKNPAPQ